jgi:enoyl-CoA hydratase/carnithine racemase
MSDHYNGFGPFEVRLDDSIARVAFNRPEVLNAVNMEILLNITPLFEQLSNDSHVRCVVLSGNGRAFSVGADHKERPTMSLDEVRHRRRIAPRAFAAMRNCVHPVIAQVHGWALGSGLELALGCDIVVMAETAVLGLIETVRASIPAGGGTQLLPRIVGLQRAKELILTGRRFTAAEAADWGIANYVVPVEELEARVTGLAREITAAAPISCQQAKRAINATLSMDLTSGIEYEAALYERILGSADRAEALAAYQEERPSVFMGE